MEVRVALVLRCYLFLIDISSHKRRKDILDPIKILHYFEFSDPP